jgi:hypothetical protein
MQAKTIDTRKLWRVGAALLLTLLLAVLLAARPAEAEPRIKVSGCQPYGPNTVDPIAFAKHQHMHFGNRSTTNSSTGESLQHNGSTTCKEGYFTSAAWFPVAQGKQVDRIAVYYRAPGDQSKVRDMPTGLKLLAHGGIIKSGNGGNNVTVHFPDCLAVSGGRPLLDSANHESHARESNNGSCPSTHPYKIPRVSFLIQYNDQLTGSTPVSEGSGQWGSFSSSFHADYFAANQQPDFNRLIDICLRKANDSQTVAHPDCGQGP